MNVKIRPSNLSKNVCYVCDSKTTAVCTEPQVNSNTLTADITSDSRTNKSTGHRWTKHLVLRPVRPEEASWRRGQEWKYNKVALNSTFLGSLCDLVQTLAKAMMYFQYCWPASSGQRRHMIAPAGVVHMPELNVVTHCSSCYLADSCVPSLMLK